MEQADWESRWSEGRIGFHQSEANDYLREFAGQALGESPGRVYVPLAGKSLDMVFLAERGAEVVGVEYVERAVRGFFDERQLVPEVDADPPIRFRSGPYELLVADFFDVGAGDVGSVDAVFDRAALVALDGPTRRRYATHLAGLLAAGARMLLITFEYDQSRMEGPPFSVSEAEVHELFGAEFQIERLAIRGASAGRFRDRGLSEMREAAYALTRS